MGLLNGVSGAVNNLVGGLFGGGPGQPSVVPTDPHTQAMIDAQKTRAGRSTADFANEANRGIDQSTQALGQGQQHAGQQNAGLGMSPGAGDAIRSMYRNTAADQIGQIKNQNEWQASLTKADYLQKAAQTSMAQQGMAVQNMQMLTEAYNQNEMARAGFINQLFQTGQYGMGMYAAHHGRAQKPNVSATPPNGGPESVVGLGQGMYSHPSTYRDNFSRDFNIG